MSFDPIPEPSMSSDYLKINPDEKHRIRIMDIYPGMGVLG